jgi:glycosyltransferase involved in cell wall biosynthesis
VTPTVTGETRNDLGRARKALVLSTLMWNRQAAAATHVAMDRFRPDVVHIHKIYPQLSVGPIVAAARAGVPIVQRAADFEFISAHPEDASGSPIDHLGPSSADRVANTLSFALRRRIHVPRVSTWMVATEFMRATYAGAGLDAEVIPHFLEPLDDSRLDRFQDREGAVFVGRLIADKGIADVIAFARSNPDIPVTLAGTGPLLARAQTEAESIPNLSVPGFLDKPAVEALLGRSRVALVPSLWPEPAGLAALEAMACGTPVVAYRCGGLTDYVLRNGGGVVVPQGDLAALAAAATKLHGDAAHWAALSQRGLEGLARNHAPAAHAVAVEAMYERTVAGALSSTR